MMKLRVVSYALLILAGSFWNTAFAVPPALLADRFEAENSLTREQLNAFYQPHGGRDAFPEHYVAMLETLLFAQDDLERRRFGRVAERLHAIFSAHPLSEGIWFQDAQLYDLNVGSPIAYYGLRMLETIAAAGPLPTRGSLNMTVLVAPCASVRRPTLPDLEPEIVQLQLAPEILADDGRILRQSTALFRHWIKAITRGSGVELTVFEMDECASVDFIVNMNAIFSYPDTEAMTRNVPSGIATETDIWWAIAPSGVPGDGSDFSQVFVTGGMGLAPTGAPLIVSDDAWFIRKPAHLGSGPYSDVERRAYLPQWFQHEFMHHLYRRWPEFGLETILHQWFNRDKWPSDFVGLFEPDYYSESLSRRLLNATPSLAEGLDHPELADFSTFPLAAIAGNYERPPVENDFHVVTITVNDDNSATWSNQANVSWALNVIDGTLQTLPDSIYGLRHVYAELDETNQVAALYFLGERYQRVLDP